MRTRLIGHRGWPARFPENSLAGFAAALAAGAAAIECDIQLSRDRQPLVLHDAPLRRLTGLDADVRDCDAVTCTRLRLLGPDGRASEEAPPPLDALAALLVRWPRARLFAEIKEDSVARFGVDALLSAVQQALAPVRAQSVIISFDAAVVRAARTTGWDSGWVLPAGGPSARAQAEALQPQWLFFDGQALPEVFAPAWRGAWRRVAYETCDIEQARDWLRRGADAVETDDIGALLAQARGRGRGYPEGG